MKKKRVQLQLTISLLVSNNIATIGKCMESIKPILESIPSELIVVDTVGKEKSDGSIAVAKEYANLVVPFQWCDDFAAARNAGLKHARGEWFMFLDDDEWFEDVTPIIDFFKSGDYQKYGVAYYNQRNYSDSVGENYIDADVGRMVHLHKETHFVRSIHERFENAYGQANFLDCFVHHYGYCYKDRTDRLKKGERNINLLLKEVAQDPNNSENYIYLAREYSASKKFEKMEEELRHIVYDLPDNNPKLTLHLNWVRFAYVKALFAQKNYIVGLAEGEQLLSSFPFYDLAKAMMYVIISEVDEIMMDWENTLSYVYKYFDKYDTLDENNDRDRMQDIFEMTITEMKNCIDGVVVRGIFSALNLGQADDVSKILKWFWAQDTKRAIVISHIEKYKKQSEEYNSILTQAISDIDSPHGYILLNKFFASETKSQEESQEAFNNYIVIRENTPEVMAAILKLVSKRDLSIKELTSNIYETTWDLWLKSAYTELSLPELSAFREKLKTDVLNENEIKYQSFLRILEKYILLRNANEKTLSWDEVEKYCNESMKNFRSLYNDELFEEDNRINLPEDAQFVISIEKCLEFKKADKLEDCTKTLKEALKKCPSMKEVIEGLYNLIEDKLKEIRDTEFNDLKYKLIQEADRLLALGNKNEANVILTGLQKLISDDKDLTALEKRIKLM